MVSLRDLGSRLGRGEMLSTLDPVSVSKMSSSVNSGHSPPIIWIVEVLQRFSHVELESESASLLSVMPFSPHLQFSPDWMVPVVWLSYQSESGSSQSLLFVSSQ